MISAFLRKGLAAWLLGAAFLAPSMAQTVLALPTASGASVDLRSALDIPTGGSLRLELLPLGSQGTELVSADLRRIGAAGPGPLVVEHSGSGVSTSRPAPRAHFSGHLVGDPQSSVFVSIDSDGTLRSIVRRGDEVFVSDSAAPNPSTAAGAARLAEPGVRSRRVDFVSDAPDRPFSCGVDDAFLDKNQRPPSAEFLENLKKNHERAGFLGLAAQGPEALGAQRRADIIIETDYELYQLLGSSSAVQAYIQDLMAYISAQYQSEIGARLNVTQINVYNNSAAVPWSGTTSSSTLLDELQAYWNAPGRLSQPRHHVHLLSGRTTGGGIAYVDTLSSSDVKFAYGVSGSIKGNFSASNPQMVWDALEVAHEIGHGFGSTHTHSYDNPGLGSSQGGAIDCCYSGSSGQCFTQLGGASKKGVLPGINSVTGGTAGTGAGIIMSYCHLISPGNSNVSFNFGTGHTRGVNPWRVASVLQASTQSYLPLDSASQYYDLTVSRLGAGTGAVTSAPAGIDCGSTCSASFAAGASVTLTAQADSGNIFSSWGGACSGSGATCSVSMSSARSVTATFQPTIASTRTVSLTKTGNGTGAVASSPSGLACAADCNSVSATFPTLASITLTASASAGSTFAGWGGVCSGTGGCTIPAGVSSASVTASFTTTANTRLVTLSKTGSGMGTVTSSPSGLNCSIDCGSTSANFLSSASVTLTAQASSGSTFTGWGGACSGTGSCTLAAGTSSASVTANFSGGASVYTQQVVTMFTGYFGRPAAASGQAYYENKMIQSGGYYQILVDDFYKSAESQAIYGGVSVPNQISQVFQQLFSRQPLSSGLTYWTQQVNQGVISVPEIAYTVAYNAASADTEVLNAKRRAALAFTQALATNTQYASAYSQSLAVGRLYLACVTGTASADAAIAKLPVTMANLAANIKTYTCP